MKTLLDPSIKVVELGDSLAGAFCGRFLQQAGASVTTVEPSTGSPLRSTPPMLHGNDDVSATHVALTQGKHVVTADLASTSGRSIIEGLVADADIVIMSGAQAEWEEQGLAVAQVRDLAATAVIGRVTTFGETGPYARYVGGELQAQALGGLMNMIGEPDAEPIRIGGYSAQYSTGMALFTGVSLGLFRRVASGAGSSFTTSVIETVAHMEWKTASAYLQEGTVAERGWKHDAPLILPCRDGFSAFFFLPHEWDVVKKVVRDPRLDDDCFSTHALRNENRDELVMILSEFTSGFDKVELYRLTQAQRMTTGYVANISDLFIDEQYAARAFFDDVDVAGHAGAKLPGAPWRWVNDAPGFPTTSPAPAQEAKVSL